MGTGLWVCALEINGFQAESTYIGRARSYQANTPAPLPQPRQTRESHSAPFVFIRLAFDPLLHISVMPGVFGESRVCILTTVSLDTQAPASTKPQLRGKAITTGELVS